jgi:ABC-type dipeptide/oligopeptide/nickel transport system permease component
MEIGAISGGAVVVERIFLPRGISSFAVASRLRDYHALQA